MTRRHILCMVEIPGSLVVGLCALAVLAGGAAGQDVAAVRADLEKAARQIDVLQPLTVGGYPAWVPPGRKVPAYEPAVVRLAGSDYPAASLVSLLADPSPRVRTLALELLFRKQDPKLLPAIFEHLSDGGNTFEHIVEYNFRANGPPDSRRDTQTVGDFAKAILGRFGFYGKPDQFGEFWAARKDRSYWFGWLRQRMLWTGGTGEPNPGLQERLLPLRRMIEGFPETDRNLYLIWLQAEYREPALATETEVAEAVRRLGRENVLAVADGHPPSSDPDLQLSSNPGRYRWVTAIILEHVTEALRPADAPRLAAIEQRERERLKAHPDVRDSGPGTSYTIAQARLLPDRASEILHAAIRARSGPFDDGYRAQLVAALFRLKGRAEMPFVREFFYRDPNGGAALARLKESDRPLVEELLDDARMGSLSPAAVGEICFRFHGIRRKLLVDCLYAQKEDPMGMGNSIQYFLRALRSGCDHGTYRAILTDARLPKLSLSILVALEQELSYYRIPRELWATFPHERQILEYFAVNSKHELSPEAVPEMIRFLRAAAQYVDERYDNFPCPSGGG